ncbi:MAG: nucleotide exchange factor GrpE [Gemmatimonadota bacterium]|jgi:molecular chaperone GrpE
MSEKATRDQNPLTADEPGAAGETGAVEEAEEHGEPGTAVDEDAEVDDGGDSPTELTAELDHLQEEFDDLNDRHLRLAAEFDNYRRRQEAQMTQAWGRAQADLVGRLLDVLDDLQRVSALDPADESVTVESIVEGIDLVERKFVRTFLEAGAQVVDPEEGEPFDPERMEAMMRVEDESGERDDQVAAVFQKGYEFKGTLVRPARVSVYKG